ncbi:hypothetical protein HYS47_00145 [Candidatus Woesearchaeota archaeon]|nr:hypothetical protein [Candidatus Woesearchaeota archaeon]
MEIQPLKQELTLAYRVHHYMLEADVPDRYISAAGKKIEFVRKLQALAGIEATFCFSRRETSVLSPEKPTHTATMEILDDLLADGTCRKKDDKPVEPTKEKIGGRYGEDSYHGQLAEHIAVYVTQHMPGYNSATRITLHSAELFHGPHDRQSKLAMPAIMELAGRAVMDAREFIAPKALAGY